MAQALTANRLIDGTVVYWRAGGWIEQLAAADVFADAASATTAVEAAKMFVASNTVVNPYLFEIRDGRPVKEREIIRAAGPSVRKDTGKQAEGA